VTPAATRHLRHGLLGVVVLLSIAVALSLRRPQTIAVPAKPDAGTPPSGTTMGGVVLRKFVEGTEKYVVKAKAMTGQQKGKMHLEGVEVTFPYLAEGKPATGTVTADQCTYDPDHQRASFRGHVRVTGRDGFFMESETLEYEGEAGWSHTDDPVKFQRGSLSGESTGAEYRAEKEALDLYKDVRLRLVREGAPPTDIVSGRAEIRRQESAVRFTGGVKVTRGAESLDSDQLNLEMSADFEKADRAVAIEDVVARAGAATLGGGKVPAGGEGYRVLRCRKLDTWFQENGQPRDSTAVKNAELEIRPAPGAPPEIRRVRAHALTFRFDEEGRLTTLEGGPEGVLTAEPVPAPAATPPGRKAKAPPPPTVRRVKSNAFTVGFDAEKGEVAKAVFTGDVEFTEPGRKAWAQAATLDETKGTLLLSGAPRLVEEGRESDLRADAIEIGTRTHELYARENVRHTVPVRSVPGGQPASGPSLFLARYLDYDSTTKTARYRENALLRSGKDELRAPLIVVEEPAPGRRRLTASGGIASLMYPRSDPGAKKPPLPVETRASEVVWEEEKSQAVYKGDVLVKQGDMQSKSPLATVTLAAGGGVEKVVAGEPVEVQQAARRANGARGTYTPKNETLVLEGEKVVLEDPQQRTEGRFLTFRSGEDRILVDGREETRPESVFKREPPKH
jgi:LPS export ABC transporter protein LptC/lipopolysaccharide transport protein LptA